MRCDAAVLARACLLLGPDTVECYAPSQESMDYPFVLSIQNGAGLGYAAIDPALLQYTVDGRVLTVIQHPDIDSISSSSGGLLGGALLTITGSGFSSALANNTVVVAGSPCAILNSTETSIICVVGPSSASPTAASNVVYGGGRGMLAEVRLDCRVPSKL